jgi:hypothetical protein
MLAVGCGPDPGSGSGSPDASGDNDASVLSDASHDASAQQDGFVLPDASSQDSSNPYHYDSGVDMDGCPQEMQNPCPNPAPFGCTSSEQCGNGLDDDCDGEVDEGCNCGSGDVQPCFLGPPGLADIGACTMGTQTCQGGGEFGVWGPCQGGIWPSPEICDDLDNDCNGCVDDPLCCDPPLSCPEPGDIVDAQPFAPYSLDGTQWYSGQASSWSWEVQGGPCDAIFTDPSWEITGADTATPTITFTLSGDYTVTMTVDTPSGPLSCTFVVHVVGPGLRVELCWEGTGSRDVDLHMLREDLNVDWCHDHDCYYSNCKGYNWDHPEWSYSSSPLSMCEDGPDGSDWQSHGSCENPRLDVDNISTVDLPENINVDAPGDGESFRIMVHYYSGSGEAYPLINVYCEGHRIATYGQTPDQVTGFDDSGGYGCQGHTWRVADVVTHVSGGVTSCDVFPLHPNGQTQGYRVLHNDTTY